MGMTEASMTSTQLDEAYGGPYKKRIAELEAALSDLHNECEHAGHDRDLDYGWPRVMAAAKSALNK